jgi:3-oxoacyl-[acyl-carrier protein] reductase
MLTDLSGKKALITGSSTGIGAAVAKSYAQLGVAVAVHANSSVTAGQAVVDEIKAAGGTAFLVTGDLSKVETAKTVVDAAAEALGGIDILLNNAGSVIRRCLFENLDEELFDQVFDLNVKSVIFVTKAALPYLRKSDAASVINTGSIAGRNGGRAASGLYASAKAAVHSITKNQASVHAVDGIRVNTVAPGVIVTPFHKDTDPAQLDDAKKGIPLGRLGQVEDMLGVYAFLASKQMSGFITGQVVDVNGGALMA